MMFCAPGNLMHRRMGFLRVSCRSLALSVVRWGKLAYGVQDYLYIIAGQSCVLWSCFLESLWCWCLVRIGFCAFLSIIRLSLEILSREIKICPPSTSSPHPTFLAKTRCAFSLSLSVSKFPASISHPQL